MILLCACAALPLGDDFEFTVEVDQDSGTIPFTTTFHASADEETTFEWTFPSGVADGAEVTWTFLGSGDIPISVVAHHHDTLETQEITVHVDTAACPKEGNTKVTGTVTDGGLTEISGVAMGRNAERLYVIEDANNPSDIVGLGVDGAEVGTWSLPWSTARDWEDIAVAVGRDGVSRIYVGDIGDNEPLDRPSIYVAVVDEPAANDDGGEVDGFEMELVYPDGPHDAETLLVDPVTEDIYVLTKDYDGPATLWRSSPPHTSGVKELDEIVTLDFSEDPLSGGATTGGDISPLGDLIVVRTYADTAFLWRRDQSEPFEAAFDRKPCSFELPDEPQGESIAFDDEKDWLWTVSELASPDVNRASFER